LLIAEHAGSLKVRYEIAVLWFVSEGTAPRRLARAKATEADKASPDGHANNH